jgi:hypothetical protein
LYVIRGVNVDARVAEAIGKEVQIVKTIYRQSDNVDEFLLFKRLKNNFNIKKEFIICGKNDKIRKIRVFQ